jgi:hypothetical protein
LLESQLLLIQCRDLRLVLGSATQIKAGDGAKPTVRGLLVLRGDFLEPRPDAVSSARCWSRRGYRGWSGGGRRRHRRRGGRGASSHREAHTLGELGVLRQPIPEALALGIRERPGLPRYRRGLQESSHEPRDHPDLVHATHI